MSRFITSFLAGVFAFFAGYCFSSAGEVPGALSGERPALANFNNLTVLAWAGVAGVEAHKVHYTTFNGNSTAVGEIPGALTIPHPGSHRPHRACIWRAPRPMRITASTCTHRTTARRSMRSVRCATQIGARARSAHRHWPVRVRSSMRRGAPLTARSDTPPTSTACGASRPNPSRMLGRDPARGPPWRYIKIGCTWHGSRPTNNRCRSRPRRFPSPAALGRLSRFGYGAVARRARSRRVHRSEHGAESRRN